MSVRSESSVFGSRSSHLRQPENITEEGLFVVSGVAIGPDDITYHRDEDTGERYSKIWTEEALRQIAPTLEGQEIVGNHENRDIWQTIGQIEESRYDEEKGVVYQGVIDDEDIARRVDQGWLDVSARIIHPEPTEMSEEGHRVVSEAWLMDNLSIVTEGNAPSNEIDIGESEMLSVEELSDVFEKGADEIVEEFQTDEDGDVDYERWMFDNPEGAQGASQSLGCSGYHKHQIQEETWYMPCSSHEAFLNSLSEKNEKSSEMAESRGKEMKKLASQFSSHTKLTKDEALNFIDTIRPTTRYQDHGILAKIVSEAIGTDEGRMKEIFSMLSGHKEESEMDSEDIDGEVEELVVSEARTPEFDGTETKSWGDIPADTLSYWTDALDYDAEQVDDLTQEQKNEIAQHTILGDPEADNVRELRFFPVVNAETGDLNRGALEAVRGGRGQSADISSSVYDSAFQKAGELLNENFDADVETEMESDSMIEDLEKGELLDVISEEYDVDREELESLLSDEEGESVEEESADDSNEDDSCYESPKVENLRRMLGMNKGR